MLKGRIAEAIVEKMLKEAGFQVYRFGYESVIQNLAQSNVELKRTKTYQKILNMPDFIVIKDGFAEFVAEILQLGEGLRGNHMHIF